MLQLAQYGEQYLEAKDSHNTKEAEKAKKNYIKLYSQMMKDNDDYKVLSKKEKQDYDQQVQEIAESMIDMLEVGLDMHIDEYDDDDLDE